MKSDYTSLLKERPPVVILGAGFGGLFAAQALARAGCPVLILDRNNYHSFLPLLYQAATAGIEPEEIAYPIRGLLRSTPGVTFRMTEAQRIDADNRCVMTDSGPVPYSRLLLATGSTTNFFSVPGAGEHAFTLKTVDDAVRLRNHILCCLEIATREQDPVKREQLLTFAVVGGGATGIEFAGALSELVRGPAAADYPELLPNDIRLLLLETAPRLLSGFSEPLAAYTKKELEKKGVTVRLGEKVTRVSGDAVALASGEEVLTRTVVWLAGVAGSAPELSQGFTVRNGRIAVRTTLQSLGHDDIFCIGDLALLEQDGRSLPMVAPVAIDQSACAAVNILRSYKGEPLLPFVYRDKGTMVTIGRNAAVAQVGAFGFRGFPAWIIWLVLHLYKLIGFRNRMMVLLNWAWDYLFTDRAVRLIIPSCKGNCRVRGGDACMGPGAKMKFKGE